MSAKRKSQITYLKFALAATALVAVAVLVPTASIGKAQTSTAPDAAVSAQSTTATFDIGGAESGLPVKYLEVDRHYNYHIPSAKEVAAIKQKLMQEEKFKEKAKEEGQQQAEKELDARIKADNDYMKEKNQLGSEKISLIEIGEHSAYVSKYTYSATYNGQCTAEIADPVNMFFYDTGWTQNVSRKLSSNGWIDSPYPEEPQCAYSSSTRPGPDGIGDLRPTDRQMMKGYDNWGGLLARDHMRMWEGGWGSGVEGWWSMGAVHHENFNVSNFDHCLTPYDPNGSSFDLGEYHVWSDALGYLPHFFEDYQNAKKPDGTSWISCGNTVNHDGIGVGVHITSDTLNSGGQLAPGMYRVSSDGRFKFIYQTDGNLVLYQSGVGAIWNTQTITSPGYAVMQTDGNFVLYNPSWQPYWATNTVGNPGAWLIVQSDGNVVICRSNGTPMWWTGTCCR
ncbi:MAG: hypothetical protein ACYCXU_08600 [Thermoleophilia bacterium]